MQKNNVNRLLRLAMMTIGISLLGGCADRVSLSEEKMAEIRNRPARPVEPPPKPERVQEFTYNAQNLRDPFVPPSLMLQATQAEQIQGVRPDETSIKEPLEQFELSELVYKGTVVSQSGELYGLVQRPDGTIASVRVGNYMGKNHGRIAEITPTQINLIEIVPDSRVGYVEKPASLISKAS